MKTEKYVKRQEKLLKDSLDNYIKSADSSKLISDKELNDIVSSSMKNQYDAVNSYQKAKETNKECRTLYGKFVFTSFLPLVISGIISGSIVGLTIANRESIGKKYDHYYAYNYITEVETIDNIDFKLEKHTYEGGFGNSVQLSVQRQLEDDKYRIYKSVYTSEKTASLYKQMLEQKQEIADEVYIADNEEYDEKEGTLEKDIYKLTTKTTSEAVEYSDTKKEGYHMPKGKKANIWGIIIANIGLITSLCVYGFRINDDSYNERIANDRKKAKRELKAAKKKMKLMRK